MDYRSLPKIELHCHLDGSVRPRTIIEIAKEEDIDLKYTTLEELKQQVIIPINCPSLDEYLKAFFIPNSVMQSKKSLRRITFELYEDAAKENIKYMEVRFAPILHIEKGLSIEEVIESVILGMRDAENKYDIKGNLILGFLRHMSPESASEVIQKCSKFIGNGVVAVDLCAEEKKDFCKKFIEPIKIARSLGYRVTIHAGETGIGKNVFDAVELLGAERIGHGIYINNCKEAYDLVKEKNITLEMCPTSNVQTKAVTSFKVHPLLPFYRDGLNVTINVDNRTVSNTTLSDEIKIAFENLGINYGDYKKIYLNAVNSSFAEQTLKDKLKNYINI